MNAMDPPYRQAGKCHPLHCIYPLPFPVRPPCAPSVPFLSLFLCSPEELSLRPSPFEGMRDTAILPVQCVLNTSVFILAAGKKKKNVSRMRRNSGLSRFAIQQGTLPAMLLHGPSLFVPFSDKADQSAPASSFHQATTMCGGPTNWSALPKKNVINASSPGYPRIPERE